MTIITTSMTIAFSLAIARVHALTISPYGGPSCTGSPDGRFSATADGQCHEVALNSESAIIKPGSEADNALKVTFYQNNDCTGAREASGNTGCLDFTGFGGNVLSYKVTSHGSKRDLPTLGALPIQQFAARLESHYWHSQAQYYRRILGLTDEMATGSLSPHWDPYAHVDAGYGHGNVTQFSGQTWKWQQKALGISIGIPIEKWDDEIHQPVDDFVVFGDHDYDTMIAKRWASDEPDSSPVISSALDKRWNYGQCRAVLSCSQQFVGGAAANIGNGWGQVVRAWDKTKTYASTLYDFGHRHPFTASIVISGTVGYGIGKTGGGATAQDNDQLASCAGGSDQASAFVQAVIDAAKASGDNAAEANITLPDGDILSISAAVFPKSLDSRDAVIDCGELAGN